MEYDPTARTKLCKCGKVSFDKKTALTKKNQQLKWGKQHKLGIYWCKLCNLWHLTHRV